ncbi:hypothetical protein AAAU52_04980 [Blautia hansenii]|uniref:hypothetical protein n=1 Tax=Blautia hansenii TaxID=1322 RepID=UPI0032C03282
MCIKIIIICLVLVCFWYYLFLKKKKELKRISVELNISVEQINKICESILQEFKKYDARVICNWGGFDTTETLNVCSRLRFSKRIDIKSTWIKKLLDKKEYWEIAFLHTIGHELGHKDKEPIFSILHTKKGRFRNWVRECRADFYGLQFVQKEYAFTRNEVLKAIELKIDYNAPDEYAKQKSDFIHPNWNLRFQLLSDYRNFNQDAIRYIAKEVGITDEKYIKKMIRTAEL